METIRLNDHAFLLDFETDGKKPALLILPGGGYFTLTENEGEPVASEFEKRGFHTFVLHYSTLDNNPECCCFEEAMYDLLNALTYLCIHSDSLHLDGNIFLLGFSAGGHLAAMFGNRWKDIVMENKDGLKINGIVLCYPALEFEAIFKKNINEVPQEYQKRMEQFRSSVGMGLFHQKKPNLHQLESVNAIKTINENTIPAFVWGILQDEIILSSDLVGYAERMISIGEECELHLFEGGTHGISLANQITANNNKMINERIAVWVNLAESWMKEKMK